MLSLEPQDLMSELLAAQKARDEKLESLEEQIRRYAGPWFNGKGPERTDGGGFEPENAAFELLSSLIPQMVDGRERCRVSTRREVAQAQVARALDWGMDRWSRDSDAETTFLDLAYDYVFRWGIAHVAPVPAPGVYEAEDPRLWPQVTRVSPWDFGWDPRAPTFRRARYTYRRWAMDKDDALKMAAVDEKRPKEAREGWDYAAIESLPTFMGEDANVLGRVLGHEKQGWQMPDRKQVVFYEVWIPELQLEGEPGPRDGFHGAFVTIGGGVGAHGATPDGSALVLPPRPFFGPRWGANIILSSYVVPDDPHPLSLLCAAGAHIERTNRAAKALSRAIENYKRIVFASGDMEEAAKAIKDSPHDFVHVLPLVGNLREKIISEEIGGPTPPMVAGYELFKNQMNQILGMDEVQRGNVTGQGTATEVSLAAQASLGRVAHLLSRYKKGRLQVYKTVLYYLYKTDEIVFPLGGEANEALGAEPGEELWFQGGNEDEGSGYSFDDLQLEIEWPTKQEEESKGLFLQNFALGIVPAIPTMVQAGLDVARFLDEYGETGGITKLSDWVDLAKAAEAAQQQAPAPPVEPRLGRDVGLAALGFAPVPSAKVGGAKRPGGGPSPSDFAPVKERGANGSKRNGSAG